MNVSLAKFFKDPYQNAYDFKNLIYVFCDKKNEENEEIYWWRLDKNERHIEIYFAFIFDTYKNKGLYKLLYVYEYSDGYFNYKSYQYPQGYELSPFALHGINTDLILDSSNLMWNGYLLKFDGNKIGIFCNEIYLSEYYAEFSFYPEQIECYLTYDKNLILYTPGISHILIECQK